MADGWKWMMGVVQGFGDCIFEVADENASGLGMSERIMIRRLTKVAPRQVPKEPDKWVLAMDMYVAYPFKTYEADTEISVSAHAIMWMAPVTDTAAAEANKFWDPNRPNLMEANESDLRRMDAAGRLKFKLI